MKRVTQDNGDNEELACLERRLLNLEMLAWRGEMHQEVDFGDDAYSRC